MTSTAEDVRTAEQAHLDLLHARLEQVRARTAQRLREWESAAPNGPAGVVEREAAVRLQLQRLAQLDAAEHGLCFGRLDPREGADPRYVGRTGLSSADPDAEPLLIDWRAPAAQPFYAATPAHPMGIARRRHIRTRGRTVVGVHDEVLDLAGAEVPDSQLTGEAALLAALAASRTGRMGDIVRTIQAEQDRVIRSDARGVLVVQGGPGTGKTAVALHRAAYLLYAQRERLVRSGLLVVGPTPTFLRYIAEVLPSLGETGVLLAGVGQLRPGLDARAEEDPAVAEVKGRLDMVAVLKAAVRDRQEVPRQPVEVVVDGLTLSLSPADVRAARTRGRRSDRLHNLARRGFARALVELLAERYAERLGAGIEGGARLLSRGDLADVREELAAEPAVRRLVERLWPRLTPERLLTDLFASERRIAAATRGWDPAERALLRRETGSPWTPADVPLLEEAEELLGGEDDGGAAARRERGRLVRQAQETLDLLYGSRSTDLEPDEAAEELTANDLLDAEALAERYEEVDTRTVAERAAADRTWTFGHVVVDEAQELSPMAWRLVARRCPTRSMTVVGDLAQTGSAAGATSWAEVLTPHVGDSWRMEELTVNYRTPAEVMALAGDVLALAAPGTTPARSVREVGEEPWAVRVAPAELPGRVADCAAELAAHEGTLAVVVPRSRVAEVAAAVAARLPQVGWGPDADSAAGPVVLTPTQTKGLEFDSVLLVDPEGVLAEGVRGASDLYVALTRTTRRLGVVSPGPLPPVLSRLA